MTAVERFAACTECKRRLVAGEGALSCQTCGRTFPVAGGIPRLYPRDDELTIDPRQLRIKTRGEAARTISEMGAIDHGFISRHRSFYALYFLLLATIVFQIWWVVAAITALLVADWLYYRSRRGRALATYRSASPRLQTVADHQAVDDLYEKRGQAQPSMSDWVSLARDAAGGASGNGGSTVEDDERYVDIKRVYDRFPRDAEVVADVGANDGRATWKFGVGAGRSVVGIDVSHLLLEAFVDHLPGQAALQADGACLPLEDGSVDFLFCTETLEHIRDPKRAVREFLRVLKPGGWLMIQSPNAHRLRNLNPFHILTLAASFATDTVLQKKMVHENTWHNGITYHWDFSIQDYRSMVQSAGGRVLELRSAQFFVPRLFLGGGPKAYAAKERILSRIPLVRFLGADLVVVAAKLA